MSSAYHHPILDLRRLTNSNNKSCPQAECLFLRFTQFSCRFEVSSPIQSITRCSFLPSRAAQSGSFCSARHVKKGGGCNRVEDRVSFTKPLKRFCSLCRISLHQHMRADHLPFNTISTYARWKAEFVPKGWRVWKKILNLTLSPVREYGAKSLDLSLNSSSAFAPNPPRQSRGKSGLRRIQKEIAACVLIRQSRWLRPIEGDSRVGAKKSALRSRPFGWAVTEGVRARVPQIRHTSETG